MVLSGNNATVIEKNAFMNVNFNYLVLGQNSEMKENRLITISSFIYFTGENLLCDCYLMWFVYFRHDKAFETQHTKGNGKCANNNKTVSDLVPGDFDCNDNTSPVKSCNASQSVGLPCEYNYLTTNLTRWIHSRNGKFIRELNKDFLDENTNILHFPFCNHEDSGEYTCMLTTDYSLLPSINRSVHLLVNGPPIVLNQHTEEDRDDLILSVIFYSIPYDFKIQWLLGNKNLNGDPQYTIAVNKMTVGLKQYNVDVTTEGFISNLTIHNFKRRPSDVYSCEMTNSYGLVVEQIVLGPASLELERRTYCDTSYSIELKCTLKLVGATPVPWIHSNAGETIRSLQGRHVNTSNILTIPFCNSQDTGDYTCRWKTDILGQTIMEKSTTLSVSGPPFVISHSISVDGSDMVFSVTFVSKPFPSDPKWYYNNEPVALGTKFLQTTTYSIVQIRQHRVFVNEEGFISNLTVSKAEYGLYKCVILNSFEEVNQLFVIEQEQNKLISTTEATTSPGSTGNSLTVIIAICSTVFGVAIVVICIIIFIRRISSKISERYNSTMTTRNEDSTYDTISMSTRSNRPDDQADYMEVL
ncbi:TTN [Mytilus coruscus]|uniref:TTN n=1 Tax=Mytilus coruscus TaxID=42192 RepID=A0A6J8DRF5_MYTCO|nr:TTN [Mytilus coruscus]